MLNAGHRKGAVAGRCVVRGKIVETEELPAYCAVALAGLDDLPDASMARSLVVGIVADEHRRVGRAVADRVNGPGADAIGERLQRDDTRSTVGRTGPRCQTESRIVTRTCGKRCSRSRTRRRMADKPVLRL